MTTWSIGLFPESNFVLYIPRLVACGGGDDGGGDDEYGGGGGGGGDVTHKPSISVKHAFVLSNCHCNAIVLTLTNIMMENTRVGFGAL